MERLKVLQPPDWVRPRGYSNGVVAAPGGRLVFISGQVGWDAQGRFQSAEFVPQARQALSNVLAILAESGGKPEHIMRLTWYVIDKQEYMASYRELGKVYRELMGDHYPAMSAVQVSALMEDAARIEIEATAVLP